MQGGEEPTTSESAQMHIEAQLRAFEAERWELEKQRRALEEERRAMASQTVQGGDAVMSDEMAPETAIPPANQSPEKPTMHGCQDGDIVSQGWDEPTQQPAGEHRKLAVELEDGSGTGDRSRTEGDDELSAQGPVDESPSLTREKARANLRRVVNEGSSDGDPLRKAKALVAKLVLDVTADADTDEANDSDKSAQSDDGRTPMTLEEWHHRLHEFQEVIHHDLERALATGPDRDQVPQKQEEPQAQQKPPVVQQATPSLPSPPVASPPAPAPVLAPTPTPAQPVAASASAPAPQVAVPAAAPTPRLPQAVEVQAMEWQFDVVTKGTNFDGSRNGEQSQVTLTAPPGYVIDPDSFEVSYTCEIGSEHGCDIAKLHTTMGVVKGVTIRAHARSQGGMQNMGCRGVCRGVATINAMPLPAGL